MKNKLSLLIVVVLICVLCAAFCACNKEEPIAQTAVNLVFDGDIKDRVVTLDLNNYSQEAYTYESSDGTVSTNGWNLKALLKDVTTLFDDNYLMITSASDGVSVLVEANLTGTIFIYQNEGKKLCSKGIDYPRAVGIKDISEISFIAKTPGSVAQGIKILTAAKTEFIGFGAAKMKLFKLSAENKMGDNTADKYLPADDLTVSNFTGREYDVAYFCDYDMLKGADNKLLSWKQGNLYLEGKPLVGFASNAETTLLDFYGQMKTCIDNNQKVMFILPDGFSWQQSNEFSADLAALSATRAQGYATSTHLAISPVALAAIVTGQSPFINGVHFSENESRKVLKPNVPDIFEYATSKGKSVSYLEGSGNLIVSSVATSYGLSDRQTYENAKGAISANKEFIFVHFHEIDDTNHTYGPLSIESKAKCIEIDSYIADLKVQFDGKIIIVPDHGHATLYDEGSNPYGKHGLFTNFDMYVPYFIYE